MLYQVTSKSTQFGWSTPFGVKTPFKHPTQEAEGQDVASLLLAIVFQLYPTGRAFYMPENGVMEKMHEAINVSFIRFLNRSKLIIEKSIPDNESFIAEDALLWEKRLGLFVNPPISLEDRKRVIARKLAYPAGVRPRLSLAFIESQLRVSGFNVRIYANRFIENGQEVFKTPGEIVSSQLQNLQYGGDSQFGNGVQHGSLGFEVVANSVQREQYFPGENLWSTFFVSGDTLGSGATISADREKEFRELILKLKPAHSSAFLIVNYL